MKWGSVIVLGWVSAAVVAAEDPAQVSPVQVPSAECAAAPSEPATSDPKERRLGELRAQRMRAQCEIRIQTEKLRRLKEEEARRACLRQNESHPADESEASKDALTNAYVKAIQEAVVTRWVRPSTLPLGSRCKMFIRQLRGGEVIAVRADPNCPYDEPSRRSAEAAVLRAQPLPYCGYESVFRETLILNFEARDL